MTSSFAMSSRIRHFCIVAAPIRTQKLPKSRIRSLLLNLAFASRFIVSRIALN
jgi:hypothetical protein